MNKIGWWDALINIMWISSNYKTYAKKCVNNAIK